MLTLKWTTSTLFWNTLTLWLVVSSHVVSDCSPVSVVILHEVAAHKYLDICTFCLAHWPCYEKRCTTTASVFSGVQNELTQRVHGPMTIRVSRGSVLRHHCAPEGLFSVGARRGWASSALHMSLPHCLSGQIPSNEKASVCFGGGINHPKPIGSVCVK